MELRQIEYFVAVVETGGFSKAAERCHVAQPSLSQQISKLEQEFGQQLFDRMGRTIALTEAGRTFLPRAKAILAEVQQARHSVKNGLDLGRGKLSVGIIPTLTPFILKGSYQRFSARYPDAEISICEDVTESLQERLVNAELDICYMSIPLANKHIVAEEIFTEKLLLAVNANHPCADMAAIKSESLGHYPFVTLHDQHCLSQQIKSFCYVHHINPPVMYHTFQLATVLEFVRANIGVALIPECVALNDPSDDIVIRPVEGIAPERTIVAARYSGRIASQMGACFTECIKQEWLYLKGVGAGQNRTNWARTAALPVHIDPVMMGTHEKVPRV
ncbi:MAG: LysR family transcriptional regulator [Chloroflexi bacterium]|nr:LysR family transcriptional regulator [Chloroflexota bacterium]